MADMAHISVDRVRNVTNKVCNTIDTFHDTSDRVHDMENRVNEKVFCVVLNTVQCQ